MYYDDDFDDDDYDDFDDDDDYYDCDDDFDNDDYDEECSGTDRTEETSLSIGIKFFCSTFFLGIGYAVQGLAEIIIKRFKYMMSFFVEHNCNQES